PSLLTNCFPGSECRSPAKPSSSKLARAGLPVRKPGAIAPIRASALAPRQPALVLSVRLFLLGVDFGGRVPVEERLQAGVAAGSRNVVEQARHSPSRTEDRVGAEVAVEGCGKQVPLLDRVVVRVDPRTPERLVVAVLVGVRLLGDRVEQGVGLR